jgi:MoxR-like ATPase
MIEVAPERLLAAGRRFRAFFLELRNSFMERDDVLVQMALALLAKEHVLLTGPPGTAKSQLSSAVLGRIVCETTGAPSLFSRQITESTVQTDLIGPIDFKNLTETGRTTHFTDEGMLGAAHAFLDEVFDGRDMLLRSALNVLQERELKQGQVVTRGRIECAVMTSNRYISEVLEQSRDTLLAFVDRIAFVGFVPRGFADPSHLARILRQRTRSSGKFGLDALLTIQDLDVLQAAADEVFIAPELCDQLAELLQSFDSELANTVRADPSFMPTRYISTRTAVRCAALLRAAVVYEWAMGAENRAMEATREDLGWLRLHLLLAGPSPSQAEQLQLREVDPIEKRQLMLLQREREIFDACFRKLPMQVLSRKPQAPKPAAKPPPLPAPTSVTAARKSDLRDVLDILSGRVETAIARADSSGLSALLREISLHCRKEGPDLPKARALLERATTAVASEGLRATMRVAEPEKDLVEAARAIVEVATALEDGSASMHPTARWMQARALEVLNQAVRFTTALDSATLRELESAVPFDAQTKSEKVLGVVERVAELRKHLLAGSAGSSPSAADNEWSAAIDRVEADLVRLWARDFAQSSATLLRDVEAKGPSALLATLAPVLRRLDVVDEQLTQFRSEARNAERTVKAQVVGPKLVVLFQETLERSDLTDREGLLQQVRDLVATLGEHGLSSAIPVDQWLTLVARALDAREPEVEAADTSLDFSGYRRMRAREQRTPLACTLAEVALIVDPRLSKGLGQDGPLELPKVLGLVSPSLREEIVAHDLARANRAIRFLEDWWQSLAPKQLGQATTQESDALADSGLLEIVWGESALARFALEMHLLEQLIPESSRKAAKLQKRIALLQAAIREAGLGIADTHARSAWSRAVSNDEA